MTTISLCGNGDPNFFPFKDELKRVAIWVRIYGLPIEYYEKHILWSIRDSLGRTVKIDGNSIHEKEGSKGEFHSPERAIFARICIKVDLRKVLVSKFELWKTVYNVEYEGLHLVCFGCGLYGHRKGANKETVTVEKGSVIVKNPILLSGRKQVANNEEDAFGPWMIVNRDGHRRRGAKNPPSLAAGGNGQKDGKVEVRGSRFEILDLEENAEPDL